MLLKPKLSVIASLALLASSLNLANAAPNAPAKNSHSPAGQSAQQTGAPTEASQKANIAASAVIIEQPWSREVPKSAKVAGGYMKLVNNSSKDEVLIAASSPICSHMELHAMFMDKGVMKMRHMAQGIKIPAGQSVIFKPGGFHVMFIDLKKPVREGDMIPVTLEFKNKGKVSVMFKVGPAGSQRAPY